MTQNRKLSEWTPDRIAQELYESHGVDWRPRDANGQVAERAAGWQPPQSNVTPLAPRLSPGDETELAASMARHPSGRGRSLN